MNPEQKIFIAHSETAAFQDGCDRGHWGLYTPLGDIVWPYVIFWIPADKCVMPSEKMFLRFNLEGYPLAAPTACPWDVEKNTVLPTESWPKGRAQVAAIFKPTWNSGALYLPCDRVAIPNHTDWPKQYPNLYWQPTYTIVCYLAFVHACLNRNQYEKPNDSPPVVVEATN